MLVVVSSVAVLGVSVGVMVGVVIGFMVRVWVSVVVRFGVTVRDRVKVGGRGWNPAEPTSQVAPRLTSAGGSPPR